MPSSWNQWWKSPPPRDYVLLQSLEERVLFSGTPLDGMAEGVDGDDSPDTDIADLADTAAPFDDVSDLYPGADAALADFLDLAAVAEELPAHRIEIVFVDVRVDDFDRLLDELAADAGGRTLEFVVLDANSNGVDQVNRALLRHPDSDVQALHFVTHGADGRVQLGNQWLSLDSLDEFGESVSRWGDALADDADLLFYGCNLAESPAGLRLVDALGVLTGADVAASIDATGAGSRGGDWQLEYQYGTIETASLSAANWDGLLLPFVVSGTVYEDLNGDGQISGDLGIGGVDVAIYIDNGDNAPGAGDVLVDQAVTDITGNYSFLSLLPGTYWVVVDGNTVGTNQALNVSAVSADLLAEQTYGAAGSARYDGTSYSFSAAAGAHYGGLTAGVTNDSSSLATMQHVIRLDVAADVANVDFGFSHSVITHTGDAVEQGSLRTFLLNANAISGLQASRFVLTTSDAGYGAQTSGAWTISLTASLPDINDAIELDATNQSGYAGLPVVEIDGNNNDLINLKVGSSTVRGLAFYDARNDAFSVHSDNNTIANNHIGVDASGSVGMGNGRDGIRLLSQGNIVEDNIISGNASIGVRVQQVGNQLLRNRIGVDINDIPLGNGQQGVLLNSSNNTIGTRNLADANTIAFNLGAGVAIADGAHDGNLININYIYDNIGLGIDHKVDGAVEPNNLDALNNFAQITKVTSDGVNIRIVGFQAAVFTDGDIDFYISPAADPSGHGEGQIYLGSAPHNNFLGFSTFDVTFVNPLTDTAVVSAITNANHASEFSTAVGISLVTPLLDLDSDDSVATGADFRTTFVENGSAVRIADTDASLSDADDRIQSLTVQIANLSEASQEILDVDVTGTTVSKAFNPTTGLLTLSGLETPAVYQTLLRAITYEHQGDNPTVGDRILQVQVRDEGGNTSVAATSTVTVQSVNDAPLVSGPATAAAITDTPLSFSSANGNSIVITDGDAGANDVRVLLNSSNGTLTLGSTTGLTLLQGDGVADTLLEFDGSLAEVNAALNNLQFLSDVGHTGSASISVNVDDLGNTGGAALNDSHTITLTVQSSFVVNDTSGPEDSAIPVSVTPIGSATSYTISGVPIGASLSHGTDIGSGQWTVATGDLGSLTLTPAADFFGSIVLNVDDGLTNKSLTVTVQAVNDLPTTTGVPNQTLAEDGAPLVVDLLPSFADVEDSAANLTYSVTGITNTTLVGASIAAGTGQLTLTPMSNATGSTLISVRATDLDGGFVESTFQVDVTAVNDAPSGAISNIAVNEDAPASVVDLFAAFADVDDADANLTFTVSANSNPSLVSTAINAGTGLLSVSYGADAFGVANLTVTATDPGGAVGTASFVVTVNAVNDAPTTSGIADQTLLEDSSPATIDLLPSFADAEDAAANLVYSVTNNTNGSVASATIASGTGQLTLTPAPNAFGSTSVTVRATDLNGAFVETTFQVDVTAVNDAPSGAISNITVNEDAPASVVDLFAAFADMDDADANLTFTVSVNSNPSLVNTAINAGTGLLSLTYGADAFGVANLTVTATDPGGAVGTASFVVTVDPVNDAPTTSGIADQTLLEDSSPATIDLLPSFADA
ncbi:MAG: DUF4347 domain-containing protein, partial [Planctomycetales bacterium]|nr:DUF4347 domain-containing protein [Planctomycetales bacterium]